MSPWQLQDPNAPKRPMSAFLAYSNSRRAGLKRENPKATNSDLSKMLSKSWKELAPEERAKYMEEEATLREKYKQDIAKWRKEAAQRKKEEKVTREKEAVPSAAESGVASRTPNQMVDNQQLLEQMQQQQQQLHQQQEQFMAEHMGQMTGDSMAAMRQQQEAMMGQDSAFGDHQQQLSAGPGTFGGFGGNPYALQAAGLGGGFPGAAFGAGNPYLANALANQAYMQGGGGGASLSALMGQQYLQNPMGQLPQQSLNQMNQGFSQTSLNQQQLNQGLYGGQLGGYGSLGGNYEG